MENYSLALVALLAVVVILLFTKVLATQRQLAIRENQLTISEKDAENAREQLTASSAAAKALVDEQRERAAAASAEAKRLIDEQRELMTQEIARAEAHFQAQALQRQAEASEALAEALRRLEALQHLQGVVDAEGHAVAMLKQATDEAATIRTEANALLQLASAAALEERTEATKRAKEVREQADALLDHATREAGRLVQDAHENATKIGGKEQMREEEKARREYSSAQSKPPSERRRSIQRALEQARSEAAVANAEQRATLDATIEELNRKLAEAEAKNQRALSMAQQTRKGTVYVVSNVGSFGDEVFKIGMTRRLEPADRIKELSDASVPFEFDVHAMIACDDAPKLEAELHAEFEDLRINRVNYRKEFFRLPVDRLRTAVANRAVDVSFTMVAEATGIP